VNSRTWTSLFYLWDPEFRKHHAIAEILDICAEKEFNDWNYTDILGWGPIHRAAAFGKGRDIQNLIYRGASPEIYTVDKHWMPIHCAVMFGNESTFDVLAELIPSHTLVQMRDSIGWGLLHLAAEHGSEKIMFKLFDLGADSAALTIPSSSVPEGLEYKELRAETIAEHCGHLQAYNTAMRAAFATDVKIEIPEPAPD
jgi:ankyrin repeat protein